MLGRTLQGSDPVLGFSLWEVIHCSLLGVGLFILPSTSSTRLVACVFTEMCALPLDRPVCWHTLVHGALLQCTLFLQNWRECPQFQFWFWSFVSSLSSLGLPKACWFVDLFRELIFYLMMFSLVFLSSFCLSPLKSSLLPPSSKLVLSSLFSV